MLNNFLTFYGKTIQIGNVRIITLSRNSSSYNKLSGDINQRLERWQKFQETKKLFKKNITESVNKSSNKLTSNKLTKIPKSTSDKMNNSFSTSNDISHISRLEKYTGLLFKKPIDINNNQNCLTNDYIKNLDDPIIGYTDASYISGKPAGIGIFFGSNHPLNTSIILDNVYNSCEAEILAAQIALKLLASSKYYRNQHIIIRTDFKAIVDAMKNGNSGRFSREYQLLRSMAKYFPKGVTFEWIKGHNGDYGNEMADYLAKTATNARSRSRPTSNNSTFSSSVNRSKSVTIDGDQIKTFSSQSLSDKIKDLVENEEMYKKNYIKKQWYK
uniref:ribonuclease H n=1 Tax=Strongyloides stercoralis TaxID=6248 RepID=A0AAF5I1V7_STRER